jgi:hypothetical protein
MLLRIQAKSWIYFGCSLVQASRGRLLTTETRVQSQGSLEGMQRTFEHDFLRVVFSSENNYPNIVPYFSNGANEMCVSPDWTVQYKRTLYSADTESVVKQHA